MCDLLVLFGDVLSTSSVLIFNILKPTGGFWIIVLNKSESFVPTCLPIFFFLFFTASQDKTSRKHIMSTASSNPEPRKESLPLGTGVNESSLLLEVRNHMGVVCMCGDHVEHLTCYICKYSTKAVVLISTVTTLCAIFYLLVGTYFPAMFWFAYICFWISDWEFGTWGDFVCMCVCVCAPFALWSCLLCRAVLLRDIWVRQECQSWWIRWGLSHVGGLSIQGKCASVCGRTSGRKHEKARSREREGVKPVDIYQRT